MGRSSGGPPFSSQITRKTKTEHAVQLYDLSKKRDRRRKSQAPSKSGKVRARILSKESIGVERSSSRSGTLTVPFQRRIPSVPDTTTKYITSAALHSLIR